MLLAYGRRPSLGVPVFYKTYFYLSLRNLSQSNTQTTVMSVRAWFSLLLLLPCMMQGVVSFECGNGETLQVHLVPHTHDDVGWLKTVDQYYIGSMSPAKVKESEYCLTFNVQGTG